MSDFEDRLKTLRPRPAPDPLWNRVLREPPAARPARMKERVIVALAASVLLACLVIMVSNPRPDGPGTASPSEPVQDGTKLSEVTIGGIPLTLEVASTEEERVKGLRGRAALPEGQGMLFVYDSPRPLSFWMKDCLIPLDIAFFDAERRLLNVVPMRVSAAPAVDSGERANSRGDARYVVETRIGWFTRSGLADADGHPSRPVTLDAPAPPGFLRVWHAPGLESEAARIRKVLESAFAVLQDEFRPLDLARLGEGLKLSVEVAYESPGGDDNAISLNHHAGGGSTLRLPVVPRHGEHATEAQHAAFATYAYCQFVLDGVMRPAGRSTNIRRDPLWFYWGYVEYLKVKCLHPADGGAAVLDEYRSKVRADAARIQPGFDVRDVSLDGAVILAFLNDEFGQRRVQTILSRPEDLFWDAVEKGLGMTEPQLYERWLQWMKTPAAPPTTK